MAVDYLSWKHVSTTQNQHGVLDGLGSPPIVTRVKFSMNGTVLYTCSVTKEFEVSLV